MAITIERVGQRVYFGGDTYAAKDQIKRLGGHWDGDRRAWWVGAKKEDEAHALAAKLRDAGRVAEADAIQSGATTQRPKEDPCNIDLTGKCEYKGRTYYMGRRSHDGTRVRLLTLPDAKGEYLDFWADASAVRVVKRYEARERWNGRRGSYSRQEMVYPTLHSIARFIAQQRAGERDGLPQCAACGKRSDRLQHDLEDGLDKCRSCCDIPE